MKIKSHKINWATSLCAVAVFSLTAFSNANAMGSISASGPGVSDAPVTRGNPMTPPGTTPVPPSTGSTSTVSSGTYNGTVMAD